MYLYNLQVYIFLICITMKKKELIEFFKFIAYDIDSNMLIKI